jgi:hypothetical protein
MFITRQSPLTGKIKCMELPVTLDQFSAWRAGMLAQDAFPNLSADDREFIISGLTPEDWKALYGEPE